MVDGSFCRGTDIVKAIAAGADLVGLGRLQCWALAAGGEAGIVRMLELLEDEVQRAWGCSASSPSPNSTRAICIRPRRPMRPRLQRVPAAGDRAVPVLNCAGDDVHSPRPAGER